MPHLHDPYINPHDANCSRQWTKANYQYQVRDNTIESSSIFGKSVRECNKLIVRSEEAGGCLILLRGVRKRFRDA